MQAVEVVQLQDVDLQVPQGRIMAEKIQIESSEVRTVGAKLDVGVLAEKVGDGLVVCVRQRPAELHAATALVERLQLLRRDRRFEFAEDDEVGHAGCAGNARLT